MDSKASSKRWWYALGVLLPVTILIYWFIFSPVEAHIDIEPAGKGLVALIRLPGRAPLLINSGSDASILRILGTTLPPWERRLATVVLTDGKSAHAAGAPEVFSRYTVASFVRLGVPGAKTQETALATAVRLDNIDHASNVPYGTRLAAPGVVISLTSPDSFTLSTQKRILVVSSTTSILDYSFAIN